MTVAESAGQHHFHMADSRRRPVAHRRRACSVFYSWPVIAERSREDGWASEADEGRAWCRGSCADGGVK